MTTPTQRLAEARALPMVRGTWAYALGLAADCDLRCLLLMLMAYRAWLTHDDEERDDDRPV